MNGLARMLDQLTRRVEEADILDPIASTVSRGITAVVPPGRVKDVASGTPIAHPLHPPLTALTMGFFSSALVLDLTRADAVTTRRMIGLGLLVAVPTAYAGGADWSHTAGAERRIGLVHAAVNDLGMACYLGSWLARRRGRRALGVVLAAAGGFLLASGGYLGGHLSYGMGVGVDTTTFEHLDLDWTDVAAQCDVPTTGAIGVQAAGVPVLLARYEGSIVAMADRCTHRGGPLHEGSVADGCVECPWHGSQFRLVDGSVVRGPAVRPQPIFRVRVVGERVQVARSEQRSLRTRPVN